MGSLQNGICQRLKLCPYSGISGLRLVCHLSTARYQWTPSPGVRHLPTLARSSRRFGKNNGPWNSSDSIADPTIYALATPTGRSALAIIRIAGPFAKHVHTALCPGKPLPEPRRATLRTLFAPRLENTSSAPDILDPSALALFFPAPHSATADDILELHVHGGPAIVRAVLAAIPRCVSAAQRTHIRYAEPGEFTRRAFLAGRMDLPQAEALGQMLEADTEMQRKLAVRGSAGRIGQVMEEWRRGLVEARGVMEAVIDFAEEEQLDEGMVKQVVSQVEAVRELVKTGIRNAERGRMARQGIGVVVVGKTNAGKSSLLNEVCGREAAIVSAGAGTTRDVVEVQVEVEGWAVRVCDTAGLRRSSEVGEVEREGMRRAGERAREADVVILVLNASPVKEEVQLEVSLESIQLAQDCLSKGCRLVVVVNKIDLLSKDQINTALSAARILLSQLQGESQKQWDSNQQARDVPIVGISCKLAGSGDACDRSRSNIDEFYMALTSTFRTMTAAIEPSDASGIDNSVWQESLGATERQRLLLEECVKHLEEFLTFVQNKDEDDIDVELAAECLRAAARCLAKVTGRGDEEGVDEVLGVVFEKFCVGK